MTEISMKELMKKLYLVESAIEEECSCEETSEIEEGSEEDREKRQQKRNYDDKKRRKDKDEEVDEEIEDEIEESYVDRNDFGTKRNRAHEYELRSLNHKGENDHIANRYVQAGYGDNPLKSTMVEGIIKRINFDALSIEDIEEAIAEAFISGVEAEKQNTNSFKSYLKEKQSNMKWIVFAKGKGKDDKWIHHVSADTKKDADAEKYSLTNGGEIVKVIRGEDRNWNGKLVDEFLKEKGVISEEIEIGDEIIILPEGYKTGDKVNLTNIKATPRYKIVGKTKTHYIVDKNDGTTQSFSKERIARVNKNAWNLAKKDPETLQKRISATTEAKDEDCTVTKRGDYVGVKGKDGKVKFVKKFAALGKKEC